MSAVHTVYYKLFIQTSLTNSPHNRRNDYLKNFYFRHFVTNIRTSSAFGNRSTTVVAVDYIVNFKPHSNNKSRWLAIWRICCFRTMASWIICTTDSVARCSDGKLPLVSIDHCSMNSYWNAKIEGYYPLDIAHWITVEVFSMVMRFVFCLYPLQSTTGFWPICHNHSGAYSHQAIDLSSVCLNTMPTPFTVNKVACFSKVKRVLKIVNWIPAIKSSGLLLVVRANGIFGQNSKYRQSSVRRSLIWVDRDCSNQTSRVYSVDIAVLRTRLFQPPRPN